MSTLQTQPTGASVAAFIASIEDEQKRKDCRVLMKMMKAATGTSPKMWGPGIVGYGHYHYKYGSGREGDWFVAGFAPRKRDLTLYIMPGVARFGALLKKLGPHRTGVSCLYVKRLSDVDEKVLTRVVTESVKRMRANAKSGEQVAC